jgi:hypothetical protein
MNVKQYYGYIKHAPAMVPVVSTRTQTFPACFFPASFLSAGASQKIFKEDASHPCEDSSALVPSRNDFPPNP